MKKDDPLWPFLEYRKKEVRRHVCKLPYIRWVLAIFVVAIVLLIISCLTYQSHPWFSGVLVSTSCGCFTGATFYFLVNIRTNKERQLQKEYEALKQTLDILKSIINHGLYYRLYKSIWGIKRSAFDDGYEILSQLDELEHAKNKIKRSVYDTVEELGYDPMDSDNIRFYRDKINSSEDAKMMEKAIIYISEQLTPAADKIQMLLGEREDQISFIGSHFL